MHINLHLLNQVDRAKRRLWVLIYCKEAAGNGIGKGGIYINHPGALQVQYHFDPIIPFYLDFPFTVQGDDARGKFHLDAFSGFEGGIGFYRDGLDPPGRDRRQDLVFSFTGKNMPR